MSRAGSLGGRTALVTGAGRRLGRAIALELAAAGSDVIVHVHASHDAATATSREIEALGVRSWVVAADLRDAGAIDRLAEAVTARAGRLDCLVNSAADFERLPIGEITPERWDSMLDLNLRGPALLTRALLPLLRKSRGASIVNIVDGAGSRAWSGHAHYATSKAGLIALTRSLARELAPDIAVNGVAPGTVIRADFQSEEELERIRRRTPLRRLATPVEIGRAVVFLASSPRALTGQIIAVDGGLSL